MRPSARPQTQTAAAVAFKLPLPRGQGNGAAAAGKGAEGAGPLVLTPSGSAAANGVPSTDSACADAMVLHAARLRRAAAALNRLAPLTMPGFALSPANEGAVRALLQEVRSSFEGELAALGLTAAVLEPALDMVHAAEAKAEELTRQAEV